MDKLRAVLYAVALIINTVNAFGDTGYFPIVDYPAGYPIISSGYDAIYGRPEIIQPFPVPGSLQPGVIYQNLPAPGVIYPSPGVLPRPRPILSVDKTRNIQQNPYNSYSINSRYFDNTNIQQNPENTYSINARFMDGWKNIQQNPSTLYNVDVANGYGPPPIDPILLGPGSGPKPSVRDYLPLYPGQIRYPTISENIQQNPKNIYEINARFMDGWKNIQQNPENIYGINSRYFNEQALQQNPLNAYGVNIQQNPGNAYEINARYLDGSKVINQNSISSLGYFDNLPLSVPHGRYANLQQNPINTYKINARQNEQKILNYPPYPTQSSSFGDVNIQQNPYNSYKVNSNFGNSNIQQNPYNQYKINVGRSSDGGDTNIQQNPVNTYQVNSRYLDSNSNFQQIAPVLYNVEQHDVPQTSEEVNVPTLYNSNSKVRYEDEKANRQTNIQQNPINTYSIKTSD